MANATTAAISPRQGHPECAGNGREIADTKAIGDVLKVAF
jgi:hypothetical protein